jgi:flagellin-like protein
MRRYTSVGLSPLVAVILLIAITVAAAVVVSGVFFNLAGIAGRRPAALIDQVRLVATPAGAGTWTVVVIKNTGDVPITIHCRSCPTLQQRVTQVMPAFTPLPLNPGRLRRLHTASTGVGMHAPSGRPIQDSHNGDVSGRFYTDSCDAGDSGNSIKTLII